MKRNLLIRIADLNVNLKDIFSDELRKRYFYFLSVPDSPTISLDSNYIPFKRNRPLRIKKTKGRIFEIRRNDFFAEIDFANFQGKLEVAKNTYSLDSFLRILYSLYLFYNDGFLIHASGVKKDGQGYLFSGSSLSGKTTTIRRLEPQLSDEDTILSDEIIAVRRQKQKNGEHRFFAYPTPFWGEFSSGRKTNNRKVEIEKIFFLGNKYFAALSLKEATEQLLGNIIFFSKDSSLVGKLFGLGLEFLQQVPAYQLKVGEELTTYLDSSK